VPRVAVSPTTGMVVTLEDVARLRVGRSCRHAHAFRWLRPGTPAATEGVSWRSAALLGMGVVWTVPAVSS